MRQPSISPELCKMRRDQLGKKIPGAALVIPSNPEFLRNHDVHYEYRQDTNLFYLTGFEEPESVLVFRPGQSPETVLFVRSKDPLRETWDGFRYGPSLAQDIFEVDKTFLVTDLEKELPTLLKDVDKVYYRLSRDHHFDLQITNALEAAKVSRGRSGMGLLPILDSSELLGEMRIIKSKEEIEWQKRACEITARAHVNAMKFTRPGVTERQIEGILRGSFMLENSPRMGYGAIVAAGNNATTLHYVFNDQTCKNGDLLLIDAGTEWNFFTGDITRTFPVNGKFTPAQKSLYEAVLEVQMKIIEMVKPGLPHKDLQTRTIELLTDLMLDFRLLKGSRDEIIEKKHYVTYYPHGVSHYLGMDVHDAGLYLKDGEPRKLEPGMCLTIEPGIYIRSDDPEAPRDLLGIGIRIEDNLLVTTGGNEVMTSGAPKDVAGMEAVIGKGVALGS